LVKLQFVSFIKITEKGIKYTLLISKKKGGGLCGGCRERMGFQMAVFDCGLFPRGLVASEMALGFESSVDASGDLNS